MKSEKEFQSCEQQEVCRYPEESKKEAIVEQLEAEIVRMLNEEVARRMYNAIRAELVRPDKPWWKSRTIWLGAISALFSGVSTLVYGGDVRDAVLAIFGTLAVVYRIQTNSDIKKKGKDEKTEKS